MRIPADIPLTPPAWFWIAVGLVLVALYVYAVWREW
jgi:hypothetical protein